MNQTINSNEFAAYRLGYMDGITKGATLALVAVAAVKLTRRFVSVKVGYRTPQS